MELIAAGFGVSIQCAVPGAEEVRGNGTLRRRGCFLGLRAPVGCGTKAGGPTREELEMMEMGSKKKTRVEAGGALTSRRRPTLFDKGSLRVRGKRQAPKHGSGVCVFA